MSYPNWFAVTAPPYFDKWLLPLAGQPRLRFLQVGAFTGDASLWMLRRVLTEPDGVLVDVDTWEGSDEPDHLSYDWQDVYDTYRAKTRAFWESGRLVVRRGTSAGWLPRLTHWRFDFVYIDGDHTAAGCLTDAIHAIPLLKPGGLLAFDDYAWASGRGRLHDPAPAVDVVADLFADTVTLIDDGAQAWFRKLA